MRREAVRSRSGWQARPARGMVQRLMIVLLALGGTACASTPPRAQPVQAEQSLRIRQSDFLRALESRDPAEVSEFFADDAVLHVAGMPAIHGRTAIRAFYGNVFRFLAASQATADNVQVAVSGDLAYVTGRSRNRFDSPGGPQEFAGKFVTVWERRADAWMVALYALSNDSGGPGG